MSIACPFCGSAAIQKASAIHSGGTSHYSGTVYVAGTNGGGTGRVSGTTQTALACRASPPEKRLGVIALPVVNVLRFGVALIVAIIICFIGGIVAGLFSDTVQELWFNAWRACDRCILDALGFGCRVIGVPSEFENELKVAAAIVAALSVPFGIRNTIWNARVWPELKRSWDQKMYCHTCDRFFQNSLTGF